MKRFFFWCELEVPPIHLTLFTGLLDVVAESEPDARFALDERIKEELPSLALVKAELAFSRCESLTEFLRKNAA